MNVAVTGATGFIGSHLVRAMRERGVKVTAVTGPTDPAVQNADCSVAVDIATGEGLDAALSGTDVVIHLAARNHVLKETEKDSLAAYRRTNVEGTRNVVRASSRSGAGLFVHLSSVKAMGEGSEEILGEKSICKPLTPYGISKLESEEVVRQVAEESGLRVVIFRLPMVYGPLNKGNFPRMIQWADRGLPFPLFQPDNLRSMVYVENVVAGVSAAIEKAPEEISTYILKDREDYSTRMVYSAICRELGKPPRFFPVPATLVRFGGMLSDDFRKVTGSFRVSSGKIEKELGYSPPFSLEEGIARTVAWYKRSARLRSA